MLTPMLTSNGYAEAESFPPKHDCVCLSRKRRRPTRSHIDENMDAHAWRSCKADED